MSIIKCGKQAAAISFLMTAAIPTGAAGADLLRLAELLAPVLTARQFAVLCGAGDPAYGKVRGSLGGVQTYSSHMRREIVEGLPQDQATVVLTSAADRARSAARERLFAFASSPSQVNLSALAGWCEGSARRYIRTVLDDHDNNHDAYERAIRSAKETR